MSGGIAESGLGTNPLTAKKGFAIFYLLACPVFWSLRHAAKNRTRGPMALPAKVIHSQDEVAAALAAIGLSESLIRRAAERSYRAWITRDPDWPTTTAGTMIWSEGIAEIRTGLGGDGWIPAKSKNIASVFSETRNMRIIWMRGTKGTGDPNGRPHSHRDHGTEIVKLLAQRAKVELFSASELRTIVVPGSEPMGEDVWVILVRIGAKKMYVEVAKPTELRLTKKGRGIVTAFGPRIILPPVDLSDLWGAANRPDSPPSPSPAVVEVAVSRRR